MPRPLLLLAALSLLASCEEWGDTTGEPDSLTSLAVEAGVLPA